MNTVTPVALSLPGGKELSLRFTAGAERRVIDLLGVPWNDAIRKYESGAFPAILFALSHDSKGTPPDITVPELAEMIPLDAKTEILAAIMSATTQGRVPKNELEVLFKAEMKRQLSTSSSGSTSGASAPALSTSDSPTNNSGGDTSSASLRPESEDTEKPKTAEIIEPESAQPQPTT